MNWWRIAIGLVHQYCLIRKLWENSDWMMYPPIHGALFPLTTCDSMTKTTCHMILTTSIVSVLSSMCRHVILDIFIYIKLCSRFCVINKCVCVLRVPWWKNTICGNQHSRRRIRRQLLSELNEWHRFGQATILLSMNQLSEKRGDNIILTIFADKKSSWLTHRLTHRCKRNRSLPLDQHNI